METQTAQQMQEAAETARKENAVRVIADVIECEGDSLSSDSGGNSSDASADDGDTSAELDKLDREGLLELCTMMTAGATADPGTRAGDVSTGLGDVSKYVDAAITALADENGEVSFSQFEEWWLKTNDGSITSGGTQTHDGDCYAAAHAAIAASIAASNDDVACGETVAAAVAAAEEAVRLDSIQAAEAVLGTQSSPRASPDLRSGATKLRQEGASVEAMQVAARAALSRMPAEMPEGKVDFPNLKNEVMATYVQAGVAGLVAAAAVWWAQTSMMSG